ncbi:XRE family transcriptional regulator [Parvibacter caecicola]|uniref:Uncharacterized protein n=1 Tax=Parvibacter caecicola TaxID=747645 RepID=A0A7W5GQG4_9ACTN|nr:XRE family transcriptional regulator [Parvibacter caecicola]MBB3171434.1 hypothetical protein [Parvibacter caecicola]MCR2042254.1 hypothetical protein [Parvibacter caecicola]RNL11192.1 XRE family transcriptional regulator [Parvibacter caecicola]
MSDSKKKRYSSLYEQIRCEKLHWTRAKAALELKCIDENRLERIEKNRAAIRPDEVLVLAEVYDEPSLCNYYCAMQCPIGRDEGVPYIEQPEQSELPIIVLQMIASLNSTSQMKNRLIEIAADGDVSEDELAEFEKIRQELEKITSTVKALEMWSGKAIKQVAK